MSKLLRCLALALGMVLVLTFAPTIARAASSTDTVSFEGTVDYARAEEQLKLMNAERAKVGASPLTMSSALQNTAVVRAAETALYFDHVRPNGEKWDTALQAPVSGWWGENIAAGNSTAQAVTDQWMNSDGTGRTCSGRSTATLALGASRSEAPRTGARTLPSRWEAALPREAAPSLDSLRLR